jgi:hypothetical protein
MTALGKKGEKWRVASGENGKRRINTKDAEAGAQRPQRRARVFESWRFKS